MLCEYHYDTKAICDGEGRTIVRFAVCDKNKTVIRMIEQYKSVTKLDILLCPFQDGISIEKKIQLGMFFDVIFLDMEMEGITGIEVGKWLREIRKNEKTEIIYMAEDERHVVELFQNRPFDFLLKPLTEKKVFQVLDITQENINFEVTPEIIELTFPAETEDSQVIKVTVKGGRKGFYINAINEYDVEENIRLSYDNAFEFSVTPLDDDTGSQESKTYNLAISGIKLTFVDEFSFDAYVPNN